VAIEAVKAEKILSFGHPIERALARRGGIVGDVPLSHCHPGLVPGSTKPRMMRLDPFASSPAAKWTPAQGRGDGGGRREG